MQLTIAEDASVETNRITDHEVMAVVLAVLVSKYPTIQVTDTSDIFASGLADSQEFLDIILEVEGQTGLVFNPEALDFNGIMTPLTLAQAFKVT